MFSAITSRRSTIAMHIDDNPRSKSLGGARIARTAPPQSPSTA
jgi:hypothetical protein